MWEWAAFISAVTALLNVAIKGVPVMGKEYRTHRDWQRKNAKRQRAISTVSPTTGTITKRSA
jgi:hypothetical protein